MTLKHLACSVVIGLLPFAAEANLATFSNQATFLSATGATSATGALPDLAGVHSSVQIGSVTFADVNGRKFYVGGLSGYSPNDWTTLLAGNEIAINGVENLDVAFNAPVYSAGFDFAEPAGSTSSPWAIDVGGLYMDSTFTVTLKNNTTTVGAFIFNAPDEVASFVGVWSDVAFNRMEIRETTGDTEDEYFGQFYTGGVAMPVPEPETYALMLAGLGLVGFAARRRTVSVL
jgi:hypothetical protein